MHHAIVMTNASVMAPVVRIRLLFVEGDLLTMYLQGNLLSLAEENAIMVRNCKNIALLF